MTETTIIIPLDNDPMSKQSTRFGKNRAYTCPKKRSYQNMVMYKIKELFKDTMYTKAVTVCIEYGFKKPKRLGKSSSIEVNGVLYKTTSPDVDNLTKPVLDAMMQAGVMEDDRIVHSLVATKVYTPHSYIEITIKGE